MGKRCSVPINDDGMLAWLTPTESGVDVMLIARSDQLRANELAAARKAEIGVYATARMLWLIL